MSTRGSATLPRSSLLLSFVLIAYQVLGKATRDALFVSTNGLLRQTMVFAIAALLSVLMLPMISRATVRIGPSRLLYWAFIGSSVLILLAWALFFFDPRIAALLFYLHMVSSTPFLISGYWSWVGEYLEPRQGKVQVASMVAVGAVGGIFGGLVGVALAKVANPTLALPILAGMNIACAFYLGFGARDVRRPVSAPTRAGSSGDLLDGFSLVAHSQYLRDIALLVLLTTATAQLLDFALIAAATHLVAGPALGAVASGARAGEARNDLLAILSGFNAAVAVVLFCLQALLSSRIVRLFRVGWSVTSLPLAVCLFGGGALLIKGVVSTALARAAELVTARSIFRSGYELLFLPMKAKERHAVRPIIDVGAQRIGDAGGGLLATALLAIAGSSIVGSGGLVPAAAPYWLLGAGTILALLGAWIALRVRTGYRMALSQFPKPSPESFEVRRSPNLTETIDSVDYAVLEEDREDAQQPERVFQLPPEQFLQLSRELMSEDADRVVRVLRSIPRLDARLAPTVISMLGQDALAPHAARALKSIAPHVVGSLLDRLLDTAESETLRGRIPLILASVDDDRAVDGLLRGLSADRFHVRRRCSGALLRAREQRPALRLDRDRMLSLLAEEIQRERDVWATERSISEVNPRALSDPLTSILLKGLAHLTTRSRRSFAHVFSLIALAYPEVEVIYAYDSLRGDDRIRRGIALELFELILPQSARKEIWPYLGDDRRASPARRELPEVLEDLRRLMRAHKSIEITMRKLHDDAK